MQVKSLRAELESVSGEKKALADELGREQQALSAQQAAVQQQVRGRRAGPGRAGIGRGPAGSWLGLGRGAQGRAPAALRSASLLLLLKVRGGAALRAAARRAGRRCCRAGQRRERAGPHSLSNRRGPPRFDTVTFCSSNRLHNHHRLVLHRPLSLGGDAQGRHCYAITYGATHRLILPLLLLCGTRSLPAQVAQLEESLKAAAAEQAALLARREEQAAEVRASGRASKRAASERASTAWRAPLEWNTCPCRRRSHLLPFQQGAHGALCALPLARGLCLLVRLRSRHGSALHAASALRAEAQACFGCCASLPPGRAAG